MAYRRLTFVLPRALEEPLSARLWGLGTLGLELRPGGPGRLRVDAWFEEPAPTVPPVGAPGDLAAVELAASVVVPAADWMAAYRRQAAPIEVGKRLLVDPGDAPGRAPSATGRHRLHLPARRAFGTGGHASTSLAVELLEELPLAGRRVLDLGTGTGILAFAALLFGAAWVLALDIDLVAAVSAAENRLRNAMPAAVAAGTLACLGRSARFDVVVANLRPEHLRPELARLAGHLGPGSRAIVSGQLRAESGGVEEGLRAAGFEALTRRRRDEWEAVLAERRP